jgi:hypothetical protein
VQVLNVDWLSILGKSPDSIPPELTHRGVETEFPPGEIDGEENALVMVAVDGSWEARLGDGGLVETIFLYPQHGAVLPLSLQPSHSRPEVRALLGEPSGSGGGIRVPVLGEVGPWDRFDSDTASVHVEYSDSGLISMVTLMTARAAP